MPKILIVDDSPFTRLKCKQILASENHDVIEAENGEEAIRKVETEKPDVVLMDVVMPVMDGHEACKKLKEGKYPDLPVIIVTTKSELEDLVKGFESGADDYIVKPFKKMELLSRISAMLRVKGLYDELKDKNKELKHANDELKKAKTALKEKEKLSLVGQLLVGVHHELRNPLTVVLSNSQILLNHFELDEKIKPLVSDIEGQARNIKDILDNVNEIDSVEIIDYVDDTTMVNIKKKKNK
jgi:DNA-binding response OmpR family regulator